jgi:serine/threonine-protein kinase HipA
MTDERVEVRLNDRAQSRVVGHLRDVGQGPHFQYAPTFLEEGIRLSPLMMPNETRVFTPTKAGLHRLQGLTYDALPDGWGLRLLHQAMRDVGIDPTGSSPVAWLRALGTRGMGALTFHPQTERVSAATPETTDLAALAAEARRVDADHVDDVLSALTRAGGGSGGARPKIVAGWHNSGAIADAFEPLPKGYRPVLIKFAASGEPQDAPLIEAAYLSMAERAGLDVAPHRVYAVPPSKGTSAKTSKKGPRWALVVDRFDRVGDARRHVHTFAGLLELDFRRDATDYRDLIKVALALTNDLRAARTAWQRAAFNVGAHNRDDHAKNVAFQMTEDGTWSFAPAYDLTYADGPGGYHTMLIAGESRAPGRADLLRLADEVGLPKVEAEKDLDQLLDALALWPKLAAERGVSRARTTAIAKILDTQSKRLAR